MREHKKTGVHGTLELILLAWKFNSKKLLCKTLNSRMNIIETWYKKNVPVWPTSQKSTRILPKAWDYFPLLKYLVKSGHLGHLG